MDFAFNNLHDFLQMGKHGLYVWMSYALTALVILFNVAVYKLKQKHIVQTLRDEQVRKQKQQQNTLR